MAGSNAAYHAELTNRDWEILRGLFNARLMTVTHIAAIYFDQRLDAARKRVQKLKAAGFIASRPRRQYEPAILFLTHKSFRALTEAHQLEGLPELSWTQMEKRARVADSTLKHELAVMDVKAALMAAINKDARLKVAEFTTWPLLSQFTARMEHLPKKTLVQPDGFLRVKQFDSSNGDLFDSAYEHAVFWEIDRSTETIETLAVRAGGYREYYRSGDFARRMGLPAERLTEFPFRVAIVFLTAERRNNFAERLLRFRPPITSQIWLCTMSELLKDPLGLVWIRPGDYAAVLRGTAFDPHAYSPSPIYRRRNLREELVERHIHKHALFDQPKTDGASPRV